MLGINNNAEVVTVILQSTVSSVSSYCCCFGLSKYCVCNPLHILLSAVLRHYSTLLIDCSQWNTDEKNSSDVIDLNLQVVSLETTESISFLSTLWCTVPPVAPHHNSPSCPCRNEGWSLETLSHPFTTRGKEMNSATLHFTCCLQRGSGHSSTFLFFNI